MCVVCGYVCDSHSCNPTLKIIVIHPYCIPVLLIIVAGHFFLLHISLSYVVGLRTQKPLDPEPFCCFPLHFKILSSLTHLSFSPSLGENYFQNEIPPMLLSSLPHNPQCTWVHFLKNSTVFVSIILISLEVWSVFLLCTKINRFHPKNGPLLHPFLENVFEILVIFTVFFPPPTVSFINPLQSVVHPTDSHHTSENILFI